MINSRLLRTLVPDTPLHRRTERDAPAHAEFMVRARSAGFLREPTAQPGLQRPTLVSSHDGSIARIMLALPGYAISSPHLVAGYRSVIDALRKGTRFVVVHHDDPAAIETIRTWFDTAGHDREAVQLVPLPSYVSFTDWAEDGYVAIHDAADGAPYLMEPWQFPRAGDALIAEAVAEFASYGAAQAPLIFQGGNCLIGDDFWLLGKDYFADSVELVTGERAPVELPAGMTPETLVRTIFRDYVETQRTLILIGTRKPIPLRAFYGTRQDGAYFLDIAADGAGTYQPIFHIDMFVTLLGRNAQQEFEVLVGSPRLADQLLGTRSPFALDGVYDTIANDLSRRGMKVHRTPLVHRPTLGQAWLLEALKAEAAKPDGEDLRDAIAELVALGAGDSSSVTIRSWHHITWNNCLVEASAAYGKHVYLPTFGYGVSSDLRQLDDVTSDFWSSQGFTVHRLADFNEFARRQGVVHCIKKYLERGG